MWPMRYTRLFFKYEMNKHRNALLFVSCSSVSVFTLTLLVQENNKQLEYKKVK